jgi:hypothetical protein
MKLAIWSNPPGYADPQFPYHVCKLKQALYGLKQAPRAWFHRFNSFLLQLGFTCSITDPISLCLCSLQHHAQPLALR